MFELSEEETLMNSSDGSVRLTTYRIIYDSEKGRKQMMLEDVESCELKNASIGSYGILLAILILATIIIVINKIIFFVENRKWIQRPDLDIRDAFLNDFGFFFLLVVLLIVHYLYHISRRYFIRINGKYDCIDIRVTGFKHPSVHKMIHTLAEESTRRKKIVQTTQRVSNPD